MKLSKETLQKYREHEWIRHEAIGLGLLGHIEAIEQEYTELKQENLQRREEVKELMGAVEVKSKGLAHANNAILKLCEEVKVLREEKVLLLQQIEKTLEEQPNPVVLPRKVAEAIEYFRGLNIQFENKSFARIFFREIEHGDQEHTIALKKYVENNGDKLLSALVNGYTVEKEETIEDRIKKGVQEIYQGWLQSPFKHFSSDDQAELVEQITNFVATVYQEAKQSG